LSSGVLGVSGYSSGVGSVCGYSSSGVICSCWCISCSSCQGCSWLSYWLLIVVSHRHCSDIGEDGDDDEVGLEDDGQVPQDSQDFEVSIISASLDVHRPEV